MFVLDMSSDETILDFLYAKGSLEILAAIKEFDRPQHIELRNRIHLSSSTLTKRLKEGVQHGVWQQALRQNEDGTSAKVYELTDPGEEVYDVLDEHELPEEFKQRRELELSIRHHRDLAIEDLEIHIFDWLEDE